MLAASFESSSKTTLKVIKEYVAFQGIHNIHSAHVYFRYGLGEPGNYPQQTLYIVYIYLQFIIIRPKLYLLVSNVLCLTLAASFESSRNTTLKVVKRYVAFQGIHDIYSARFTFVTGLENQVTILNKHYVQVSNHFHFF